MNGPATVGASNGRRGGIVLRVEGEMRFVDVACALRIAPAPRVTPVPGAPSSLLGVTLHEGAIVPVLAVGPTRREMIVCQVAGEVLGIVGGEILRTGTFDATTDGVEVDGHRAKALDLALVYARASARTRATFPSGS